MPSKPLTPKPEMTREVWAIAFEAKVDQVRPGMGSKYLATIVAMLWPKHHADDPQVVAAEWVKEHGKP